MRSRYAVGIVHYRSYGDLDDCLAGVAQQTVPPSDVVVVDHDSDEDQRAAVRARHPRVWIEPGPNRGFAGGANRALALASRRDPDVDWVLILNPDVRLDPGFAEALLRELEGRPQVGLASGRLLRPGRLTIDSAGIEMPRNRRPRDRASGERDRGQYASVERVFAVTGAAVMLRRSALADLEIDGEVFDEDFFAYHEDTDLAWRARLLGWECLYVPSAVAVHRRRWRKGGWRGIQPELRRHSFKNHYLEMIKNERAGPFLRDLPVILAWEGLRLGYALLRDRSRLPAYASAARLAGRAWHKRRHIRARVRRQSLAPPLAGRTPELAEEAAPQLPRAVRTT